MPRFTFIAVVLLTAILAASAAALWHGGWLPGLQGLAAGIVPSLAERTNRQELVEWAAMAIRAHDAAAVRRYLAEGGDPNGVDGEGEVLLNRAVLHGTPEILEVLLAAGADPNLPGKNDLGAPAIAALAGRHAMLKRLMQANETGTGGRTPTGAEPAPAAAAGDAPPGAAVAVTEAAPATDASRAEGTENPVPPAEPVAAPSALASPTGDAMLQAVSPAEPYASMAGLAINPIARPAAGAPAAASPAGSATEAATQPASPASARSATLPDRRQATHRNPG